MRSDDCDKEFNPVCPECWRRSVIRVFYFPLSLWYRVTSRVWYVEALFSIEGKNVIAKYIFVTRIWQRMTPWTAQEDLYKRDPNIKHIDRVMISYVGWWWPDQAVEWTDFQDFEKLKAKG